jgi:hypothetical protein
MKNSRDNKETKLSRRKFLTGFGAGTVASVATLPQLAREALAMPGESGLAQTRTDRFGRLFPNLPAFAPNTQPTFQRVTDALMDIGGFGHMLDAKDPIGRPPAELITDPAASINNPDNPNHTAGMTFLGQFLDHDMTFDTTSFLGVPKRPEDSTNTRTPGFDLDSVYGAGPTATPQFYNSDRITFRVESTGRFEDLPRASNGTAIISDPRNDENMIIAGIQVAMLQFHNRVVDRLRSQGVPTSQLFTQAQQLVRWHYQWIILNEFLPLTIGQDRVNQILTNGRRFYRPAAGQQFIPVEFQGAAYRFGHSQVRPSYRANFTGNPGNTQFFGMIFDPAGEGQADPVDLRGGKRAPRRFIGWSTFFDFGDGFVRNNKRIDTKISTALFRLPLPAIAGSELSITALPQRNLLRHLTWSLPSGQAIAGAAGLPSITAPELSGYNVGLNTSTPLWYYVLKEAEQLESGLRLGPVGSLIVGEVFIGLLQLDSASFLRTNPSWRPTLPRRDGSTGDFRMVDLLTFAGVAGIR